MIDSSLRRRALFTAGGAVAGAITVGAAAGPATAAPPAPTTPRAALKALLDGNRRFVSGHSRHPHQSVRRLHEVAAGQHPFAVLLGCADSRVSPELLFDQGIGDLFDDRVAGNIVDDLLLGSMEYAIEEFAPPLVMVLGHERCGAISATRDAIAAGTSAPGHIQVIVDALRPIVTPFVDVADGVELAVRANVRAQVAALLDRSEIIREKAERRELAVVGARYDLDTGLVTVL